MTNEPQKSEGTDVQFDHGDVSMLVERLNDVDPDWAVEPGWRELRGRIMFAIHVAESRQPAL